MAKFKVAWTQNGVRTETEPVISIGYALHEAQRRIENADTILILRDSEGEDHPDNAGKFFLALIVK